ncbi:MAG TPA: hypothetical protein VGO31_03070 [Microbacteriaceae bacterium]|jgi:hypothetical protein|nr:hypothetical protein [Microbacteriaceae bacterium]
MRTVVSAILALALASVACARSGQTVRAHGVAVSTPADRRRVPAAGDGPITDPRTLLVVGTAGVAPKATQCQIGTYRVPSNGAVVVIVGWKTATSGGGRINPGRWPLKAMTSVRRPSTECFAGRGASASVALGRRAYQVNVMVGDSASTQRVAAALAVGRSFRLTP